MCIMGWSISVTEGVCISIAGGLAADYTVHIAHAFIHTSITGSYERAQGAFSKLLTPLAAGGLTTLAAVLPLFFCNLLLFNRFGAFIAALVLCSFINAAVFFILLLLIAGPDGDEGSMLSLRCFRKSMVQEVDSEHCQGKGKETEEKFPS